MFGLLLKLALLSLVVGAVVVTVSVKKDAVKSYTSPERYQEVVKNIDTKVVLSKASDFLDNIITHGNSSSPVVLGLKVTNESLGAITDVLQKLPNDQLDQIRSVMCASSSAN
jgi:predicted nuclease of predicted toxin-antitoxin system